MSPSQSITVIFQEEFQKICKLYSSPWYSGSHGWDPSKPVAAQSGGGSPQLLARYGINKQKYFMLSCGDWVKGRDEYRNKKLREDMSWRGEPGRIDTNGEKSCATTHSEEKAGDCFRWRALHSSLFIVARIRQVSAAPAHASSTASFFNVSVQPTYRVHCGSASEVGTGTRMWLSCEV